MDQERLSKVRAYVGARMQENTTWVGVTVIVSAVFHHLEPQWRDAILVAGPGLAGFLLTVFPDKFK